VHNCIDIIYVMGYSPQGPQTYNVLQGIIRAKRAKHPNIGHLAWIDGLGNLDLEHSRTSLKLQVRLLLQYIVYL